MPVPRIRPSAARFPSALILASNAALADYLERDEVEDALIVRRLDDVTHTLGHLTRDLETLAVGFGSFAWYSFLRAPAARDATVVRGAETEYREFLKQVGRQLREGIRFTEQVLPAPRQAPGKLPGTEMGGREKERKS